MKNIDISIISTLLTVFAAFIGLISILRFYIRIRKPNIKLNADFFEQLDKKFELGLVSNKEDITVLADSFRREHVATYDLNILLEDYLRYLINKASNSEGDVKQTFIERHQKANQIFKEHNEEKPYNDLPAEERRIFRTITSTIKTGEKEETLNALEDLRIVISTKNKSYQQSNTINKLSIPLAVIGLILTIYFGIKSLPSDSGNKLPASQAKTEISKPLSKDTLDLK